MFKSPCKLVPYLSLQDREQCPPPALTVDIKQQHASAWSELQNACSHSCLAHLVTSIDTIFGGNLVFGFTVNIYTATNVNEMKVRSET